jgi:uncharacterized protein (TIGR03435 family)
MSKIVLLIIAGATAFAQTNAPRTFEVASVKVAAPCCAPGQWRESKAGTDRIDFRYVTLRYCVAFAYGLKEYQVSGPSWITELRYDIVAKGAEGTRHEQLPEMVQALLRERFKLEVHREKKEYNVYALVVGKSGAKLTETPKEGTVPDGAAFGISMSGAGVGKLEAKHADMTSLANTLPRFVGRPVVDLTGISGRYDLDLDFSRDDVNGMVLTASGTPAPPATEFTTSIFSSIQRIGLRLDPQKLPLDSIVIDRAERVATEN